MELLYDKAYKIISIRTPTTDGELFTFFTENTEGKVIRITITIGKSGSQIYAWTSALTECVNMLLDEGVSINEISIRLANIYTDRITLNSDKHNIRSGPDGFVNTLNKYIRNKNHQFRPPFDMPWDA